jgi:hypothetical protein
MSSGSMSVTRAVRRHRPSGLRSPSQTWRSFLENHRTDIAAMDFFNVTTSPSAQWTARQVVEAFPYETQPRFLLHDRDSIFGSSFARRVGSMGIKEVVTAPGSPWQNPYCERLIGSIRRASCSKTQLKRNAWNANGFRRSRQGPSLSTWRVLNPVLFRNSAQQQVVILQRVWSASATSSCGFPNALCRLRMVWHRPPKPLQTHRLSIG